MLNHLLDKSQFMIVSLLIMSEIAHLHKDIVYKDVAKD